MRILFVPPRTSIASYVETFASRGPDVAFVYTRGLRRSGWTYARVARAAHRFARELESRGVAPGDRVVIWGRNAPEWVAAFYGCALRGAIAVPLDDQSLPDFVARVVEQVQPRLLLTDHAPTPGALAVASIFLDDLERAIERHAPDPYPGAQTGPEDTVEIIFTSGTTATPKGVRITNANLLANLGPLEGEIEKYLKWERLVHPIRFLNLLPLSHVFGQFMGIFVPQLLGGQVVFSDSLSPSQIVETVRRNRISVVVAVPRILQALRAGIERDYAARGALDDLNRALEAADKWGPATRWWKFRRIHRTFGLKFWAFVSGGATLDAETELFWRRLGFAIVQGYGMTETASLITVNHPFKMSHGSIGKVMAGQEVKVDETGEILVRGPNITPGYWGDEGGGDGDWFRTGDIGAFDEQGNLYFKGRKKDVIVTGAGMNVYPEDIEAALHAQPEVVASAVVGIDGPAGPEPAAALILRNGGDAAAAVRRANESLADYQQIRRWIVWPDGDFPRTPTHKVRKPVVADALRAWAARTQGDEAGPAPASPLADLISRVGSADACLPGASAALGADLNLDSLARVELMSLIEERYQVDVDEAAFTAATTVADLERIVRDGGAGGAGRRYPYPRWAQRWPVTWLRVLVFYALTLPAARLMCRVRVRGREHVRDLRGPVLFVSNHILSADAGLIMSALPGRFRRRLGIAMEGEVLAGYRYPPPDAGPLTRLRSLVQYVLVVALFNVFPLPQKSGFRRSFAFAGELIDRGYSVLVFPEGRRTPDGRMHEFRSGVGILTGSLSVPVVPVRIDGLYEAKVRGRYFVPPGAVTVTFGEPVTFSADEDAARVARELERRVAALGRPE